MRSVLVVWLEKAPNTQKRDRCRDSATILGLLALLLNLAVLIASGQASLAAGSPSYEDRRPTTQTITVDDLVRRAHIPVAALSPNGQFAAYLLVRGNPNANAYELEIRVVNTRSTSK